MNHDRFTRILAICLCILGLCFAVTVFYPDSGKEAKEKEEFLHELQPSSLAFLAEFVSGPEQLSENSDFGLIEVIKKDNKKTFFVVVTMPFSARPGDELLVQWYEFNVNEVYPACMVLFVEQPKAEALKAEAEIKVKKPYSPCRTQEDNSSDDAIMELLGELDEATMFDITKKCVLKGDRKKYAKCIYDSFAALQEKLVDSAE